LAGNSGGTSADTLYDYVEAIETVLSDELREIVHEAMKMEKDPVATTEGCCGEIDPSGGRVGL
jgi:hypothetical protein